MPEVAYRQWAVKPWQELPGRAHRARKDTLYEDFQISNSRNGLARCVGCGGTNILQRVGFRHGIQQSPWSEVRSGRQSLCCGGWRGGNVVQVGVCKQVVAPIGPYTGGFTARISKVTPDGTVTTVAD